MRKLLLLCVVLCNHFITWGFDTIEVLSLGKGKPLVIIPGIGGAGIWKSTIDQLARCNRCHIVSIKGLDGQKNSSDLDIDKVIDELVSYIKREDLNKPMLMGHSFGGFVAMQAVASNPDVFSKLMLIDSYPFSMAIYNPSITQEVGAQQSQVFRNQIAALPGASYSAYWQQNAKEMVADTAFQRLFLMQLLGSERKHVVQAQCSMMANDLRPLLSRINCPTRVLASIALYQKLGIDPRTARQRIEDQFSNLGNCSIFIHESARHFIMLDDPNWFAQHISTFVR